MTICLSRLVVSLVLLSGVAPASDNVACKFGSFRYWYNESDYMESECYWDDAGHDKNFMIPSSSDPTIQGFVVNENVNVKYLPANFGEKFPSLFALHAVFCAIKSIEKRTLEGLELLTILRLDHNEILFFDENAFRSLTSLKQLRLDNNKLYALNPNQFRWLTSLEYLDLNANKIQSFLPHTFDSLVNLHILLADDNRLRVLEQNLLTRLVNLTHFSASRNELEKVPENLFVNNKHLEWVWFDSNKIKAMGPKLFVDKANLRIVDVEQNVCVDDKYVHPDISYSGKLSSLISDLTIQCTSGYRP